MRVGSQNLVALKAVNPRASLPNGHHVSHIFASSEAKKELGWNVFSESH